MTILDDIQSRIEAATAGPWTRADYVDIDQDGSFDLAHVTAPDPHEPETAVQGVAMGILRQDADFIAHAREDVPRLLDALEAVRTLHTRVAIYECDDNGFPQTEDESKHVRDICGTCSDSSVTENLDDGNYDLAGEWGEVGYPCPTVKTIATALGDDA